MSKTGTDNTDTQKATTPILVKLSATIESLSMMCKQKITISIPIMVEPPSPINILDFFPNTLCTKNGIKAPEKVLGTYVEVSGLGRCKIKDFNSRSPKYAFSVETASGKVYRT
ncbi:MAG: hypothetical protein IIT85_05045, partial [Prevotella sp.]|nr:hypothetical protein [Prevotella sp.]